MEYICNKAKDGSCANDCIHGKPHDLIDTCGKVMCNEPSKCILFGWVVCVPLQASIDYNFARFEKRSLVMTDVDK